MFYDVTVMTAVAITTNGRDWLPWRAVSPSCINQENITLCSLNPTAYISLCVAMLHNFWLSWNTLYTLRNMPLLHTSTQCPGTSQHVISFTRPFPMLVLQATNAGVRRPGYYKAQQTTHTTISMYCKGRHVHKMVHFGIIWLLTCINVWHSRVQILLYLELHTPNMEYSYLVGYVHIGSMLDQRCHNPHITLPSCHQEGCLLILHKSSTTKTMYCSYCEQVHHNTCIQP